jgi:hypothetical protein
MQPPAASGTRSADTERKSMRALREECTRQQRQERARHSQLLHQRSEATLRALRECPLVSHVQ